MSVTYIFTLIIWYHYSGWRFRGPTTCLRIGAEFLTLASLRTPLAWQIIPGGSELSLFMLWVNISVVVNIFPILAPQVLHNLFSSSGAFGAFYELIDLINSAEHAFHFAGFIFYQDGLCKRGERIGGTNEKYLCSDRPALSLCWNHRVNRKWLD